jgi:hypothetical protein
MTLRDFISSVPTTVEYYVRLFAEFVSGYKCILDFDLFISLLFIFIFLFLIYIGGFRLFYAFMRALKSHNYWAMLGYSVTIFFFVILILGSVKSGIEVCV